MSECGHVTTRDIHGTGKGAWCISCGEQIFAVETRPCKECTYSHGYMCRKHVMHIAPEMLVMFKISIGTCWTERP
jgi:hypothetical protein